MSELLRDGNALTEQDKTDIRNGIGLGTAATLNVPSSGNATSGQVVKGDDTRLTDSREWTAATVDQTEAENGTATTRRAWTAQRVRQAISAWWAASAGSLLKTINGNSLLGSGDLTIGGGGGATNLSYTASATGGTVSSDTGTDATLPPSDGTNAGLMAPAQNSKLAGIAAGATANSSDATLLNRANHTGTQAAATISDSTEAGRALLTAADAAAQRSALGLGTAATTAAIAYATAAQGTTADGAAQKSANLSDLASASTARTNLGVASAGAVTGSGLTMATARLLGRSTASTGAVEEITVGSGLTLSAGTLSASGGGGTPGGSNTQIQYNNSGAFGGAANVAVVSSGGGSANCLAAGDSGANPGWISVRGSPSTNGPHGMRFWSATDTVAMIGYDQGTSRQAGIGFLNFAQDTLRMAVTCQNGDLKTQFGGLIYPKHYTTATRPAWANGAVFFDDDLDKLVVGGVSAWEVVTST